MDPSSPMTNSMGPESPTNHRGGGGSEEAPGSGSGGDPRYYPHYHGYGYPPHMGQYPPHMAPPGSGGGPPGGGSSAYGEMPPYGGGPPPPPHHLQHPHHPSPYGAPPGYSNRGGNGMPPYGYGYDARYYPQNPSMKPQSQHTPFKSTRGGHTSTPSGGSRDEKSPESRTEEPASMKPVEDLEAERLKASADIELSLSEVKPILTDFHFFVKEVKDKLRLEAENEVHATVGDDMANDSYLINSNLNCRLMKAWEDLSSAERESYGKKEEADRRRFMEEDEVASRHCATLTARVKSPADPGSGSPLRKGRKPLKEETSDLKMDRKPEFDEDEAEEEDDEEDEDEEEEEEVTKRELGESHEADESPSKKNRIEDEEVEAEGGDAEELEAV